MATNHKVFSDFEVATAEEANNYLMDQSIVKVDAAADLTSLPTTVKTAYVLNTGILMARDVANEWKPQGGAAAVSETAPANPQVGQLWVKPSEVLPLPVRGYLHNGNGALTASTWATVPGSSTLSFTTDKAVMCQVTYSAWLYVAASGTADVRARLSWSGALAGNTYDHLGGWGGIFFLSSGAGGQEYHSFSQTFPLALPAGTTTFAPQGYRTGTPTVSNVNYSALAITPIAWADEYAAGVS